MGCPSLNPVVDEHVTKFVPVVVLVTLITALYGVIALLTEAILETVIPVLVDVNRY